MKPQKPSRLIQIAAFISDTRNLDLKRSITKVDENKISIAGCFAQNKEPSRTTQAGFRINPGDFRSPT